MRPGRRPIEFNIFKALFGIGIVCIICATYSVWATTDGSLTANFKIRQRSFNQRTNNSTPTPSPQTTSNATASIDNDFCDVKLQNITVDQYCAYVSNPNNTGCDNPYIKLQYCAFSKVQPLYFTIMIIFIGTAIFILGDTCSNYLLPSLVVLSKLLYLPPHVAGVTLLSIGNASPNIVSMIISTVQRKPSLALNANLSGELFVCCIVMGAATILADIRGLNRRPFLRDTIMSLCSYLFCFYMSITNRARVYDGVICMLIWITYVLLVLLGREIRKAFKKYKLNKQKKAIDNIELQEQMLDKVDLTNDDYTVQDFDQLGPEKEDKGDENLLQDKQDQDWEGGWNVLRHRRFTVRGNLPVVAAKTEGVVLDDEPKLVIIDAVEKKTSIQSTSVIDDYVPSEEVDPNFFYEEQKVHPLKRFYRYLIEYTGWVNMKWYEKILYVTVLWYCNFIRNLTIFRAEREDWSRFFTVLVPIFAPLAVITAYDFNYWGYMINNQFPLPVCLMLCCSVFSLLILLTTRTDRPPIYQPLLVFLAFAMSIVWVFLLCTQILNSLAALGAAWDIPNNILGITVLSWGNSIPDLLSNTLVAMRGYPTMCTGSVYGGLNLILSIGIAFTFNTDVLGGGGCYFVKPDPVVNVTYIFLIIQSVATIIVVPLSGWRFPKIYGIVLILFYVCYMVMSFLGTLYPPVSNGLTWRTIGCSQ